MPNWPAKHGLVRAGARSAGESLKIRREKEGFGGVLGPGGAASG
jgi:hypothetical protein